MESSVDITPHPLIHHLIHHLIPCIEGTCAVRIFLLYLNNHVITSKCRNIEWSRIIPYNMTQKILNLVIDIVVIVYNGSCRIMWYSNQDA